MFLYTHNLQSGMTFHGLAWKNSWRAFLPACTDLSLDDAISDSVSLNIYFCLDYSWLGIPIAKRYITSCLSHYLDPPYSDTMAIYYPIPNSTSQILIGSIVIPDNLWKLLPSISVDSYLYHFLSNMEMVHPLPVFVTDSRIIVHNSISHLYPYLFLQNMNKISLENIRI